MASEAELWLLLQRLDVLVNELRPDAVPSEKTPFLERDAQLREREVSKCGRRRASL